MSFALEWSLEARNVAVLGSESFVHDKDCEWTNNQEDPKGVNQVNLNPGQNEEVDMTQAA